MTVDRVKGEQTIVWTCAVLNDGTIVSGDSMGNIKFFDGEMGTQLQSFKTHKADVLCLAVGSVRTAFTLAIRANSPDRMVLPFSLLELIKKPLNFDWSPLVTQDIKLTDLPIDGYKLQVEECIHTMSKQ